MMRIEFKAMGSHILAALESDSLEAENALQAVPVWFEEWEQSLSRFRADSELSCLNRAGGRQVPVSDTLWEVFQVARRSEQETAGLVRPTLLDALLEAGYDRSFESLQLHSGPSRIVGVKVAGLAENVICDPASRSLNPEEGTHLDLGGVAKGWAADKASRRLKPYGAALVDAGGDIAITGQRPGGEPWAIGISDPFQPEKNIATLLLNDGAVATSGTDYHRWKQGKLWNHHIIDPRNSLPAKTDLLTVSVVAPNAIRAEAAAKAALILGSSAGMDWLEAQPDLAGLLVLQFGEIRTSLRMTEFIWRENDEHAIR